MLGQPRIDIEKRLLCLVIIAAQVLKQQQTTVSPARVLTDFTDKLLQ